MCTVVVSLEAKETCMGRKMLDRGRKLKEQKLKKIMYHKYLTRHTPSKDVTTRNDLLSKFKNLQELTRNLRGVKTF